MRDAFELWRYPAGTVRGERIGVFETTDAAIASAGCSWPRCSSPTPTTGRCSAREDALDGKLPSDDGPVQLVVTEVRSGDHGLRPVCGVVHQIIGADGHLHIYPLSD
jgi:hypothetical protein